MTLVWSFSAGVQAHSPCQVTQNDKGVVDEHTDQVY